MSFGNSGILDYHVMMALQQGWTTIYKGNFSNFSKLFQGVATAVVQTWYDALNAKDVDIRLHGARGTPRFPGVVVRLESESLSNHPIGTSYVIGDELVHPFIISQRVLVECRAPGPEVTRALAIVVRAILHLARGNFLKDAAYAEFLYDGAEGLSPEEEMLAEQAGLSGITVWRAHYSGTALVSVPDPVGLPAAIDWFVLANDLKLDGIAGGVVPSATLEPEGG